MYYGCVGSSLLFGLSLVEVSRGCSSLQCKGFSLQWLLLLQHTGSGAHRPEGSVVVALWPEGSVVVAPGL